MYDIYEYFVFNGKSVLSIRIKPKDKWLAREHGRRSVIKLSESWALLGMHSVSVNTDADDTELTFTGIVITLRRCSPKRRWHWRRHSVERWLHWHRCLLKNILHWHWSSLKHWHSHIDLYFFLTEITAPVNADVSDPYTDTVTSLSLTGFKGSVTTVRDY
jgi:hypothetical protein